MIGGYRSILNPVGLLRETRHHGYPDKARLQRNKTKRGSRISSARTNDCLYTDQASSRLKDTFYILVARTNMGAVLSYAYMHWRIKVQEVRADQ
jgi:hypothetical protein